MTPRHQVPELLPVQAGKLAGIADGDEAFGDADNFRFDPDCAAALDRHRPHLDRDIGRVEIEGSALVERRTPVVGLETQPAPSCSDDSHPIAELLDVGLEAFGALV
jgi:hypothetical protein